MTSSSPTSRPHLFGVLAGLFLAIGITFAASILASTWIHLRESQIITTAGSARQNIKSDLVVWDGELTVEHKTLAEAHAKFQRDSNLVRSFLKQHEFPNFTVSPVKIQEVYRGKNNAHAESDTAREIVGYRLIQGFQISSSQIGGITRLAADNLELLGQDVTLRTLGIQFIYTKVEDTRVQMASAATADARRRAEEIANQGGRTIAHLRTAKIGVVQINPVHSTATSWEGNNDTSTFDKTIIITVSAEFALK